MSNSFMDPGNNLPQTNDKKTKNDKSVKGKVDEHHLYSASCGVK